MWHTALGFHSDRLKTETQTPHSVLVFPFFRKQLIWVLHPTRGWEVPGGKLEQGETPNEAVSREAMEEAGLQFSTTKWIGEYQFFADNKLNYKWVYLAEVLDVKARPIDSEILDVRREAIIKSPSELKSDRLVSPVLQDEVYERVYPLLMSYT